MSVITQTRIIIGANAYASVKYKHCVDTENHVGTIDFLLPGGRGAPADLVRIAEQHRERAAREIRMAEIAEAAAFELNAVRNAA